MGFYVFLQLFQLRLDVTCESTFRIKCGVIFGSIKDTFQQGTHKKMVILRK